MTLSHLTTTQESPYLDDKLVVLGPLGEELPGCFLVIQVAMKIGQQHSYLITFSFNDVLLTELIICSDAGRQVLDGGPLQTQNCIHCPHAPYFLRDTLHSEPVGPQPFQKSNF